MFGDSIQKALFLSAHSDDLEISASGLAQRLIENGVNVVSAVFGDASISLRSGWAKDTLFHENKKASELLGITNTLFFKFPVRHFSEHRQEILEQMIILNKQISPDLIITHSPNDLHQDHMVVGQEALRAFINSTVLGYSHRRNDDQFIPNMCVELSEQQLQKKIQVINCYKSQAHRNYTQEKQVTANAVVAGMKHGFSAAETFCIMRHVWRKPE